MTMKDSDITLYQWADVPGPDGEYLDIDWPKVHKEVGVDQINWIKRQGVENCDLHVELFPGGRRLIVAFENKKTLQAYHLMWAK